MRGCYPAVAFIVSFSLLRHIEAVPSRLSSRQSSQIKTQVPEKIRFDVKHILKGASLGAVDDATKASGTYIIVPGQKPGGFPMWKQAEGDHYLFSGSKGRWIIGGERAKNVDFHCEDGLLASRSAHHGVMPNRLGPQAWRLLEQQGDHKGNQRTQQREVSMKESQAEKQDLRLATLQRHVDESPPGICQPCKAVERLIGPASSKVLPDTGIRTSAYEYPSTTNKHLMACESDDQGGDTGYASRLDGEGITLCDGSSSNTKFVQATFEKRMRVTHVETKGKYGYEFVRTYKIDSDSPPKSQTLNGNEDGDHVVTTTLPIPLEAKQVMLFPQEFEGKMSLRWDVLGCECVPWVIFDDQPDGMCKRCTGSNPVQRLIGTFRDKAIEDSDITASSYLHNYGKNGYGEMFRSRIDWAGGGAWVSGQASQGQYVEARFKTKKRVTAVITRGGISRRANTVGGRSAMFTQEQDKSASELEQLPLVFHLPGESPYMGGGEGGEGAGGERAGFAPLTTRQVFVAFGGSTHYANMTQPSSTVEVFDFKSNKWSTELIPPLPRPLQYATGGQIGRALYVFGDERSDAPGGPAYTFKFDPETGWCQVRGMLEPNRAEAAAAISGGKLYVTGGFQSMKVESSTAFVELYDPAEQRWKVVQKMSIARRGHSAVGNVPPDNTLIVMGGPDHTAEQYDPKRNAWSKLPNLPKTVGRYKHAAALFVVAGEAKIFVAGGCCTEGEKKMNTGMVAYNVQQKTWTKVGTVPQHGGWTGFAGVNGGLLAAGGYEGDPFTQFNYKSTKVTANAKVFDPNHLDWTSLPPMSEARESLGGAAYEASLQDWVVVKELAEKEISVSKNWLLKTNTLTRHAFANGPSNGRCSDPLSDHNTGTRDFIEVAFKEPQGVSSLGLTTTGEEESGSGKIIFELQYSFDGNEWHNTGKRITPSCGKGYEGRLWKTPDAAAGQHNFWRLTIVFKPQRQLKSCKFCRVHAWVGSGPTACAGDDGLIKIYEYVNVGDSDHEYTARSTPASGDWKSQGVAFQAYDRQLPGTAKIYGYYHAANSEHEYTSRAEPLNDAWTRIPETFYAYPGASGHSYGGVVPVYEYYDTLRHDRWYTIKPPALTAAKKMGIAFYGRAKETKECNGILEKCRSWGLPTKAVPAKTNVDYYTKSASGCECYWDKTRKDCACCRHDGCQCKSHKFQCVKCGQEKANCGKDYYTVSATGCRCDFDKQRTDCACCQHHSCQCSKPNKGQCVKCGNEAFCGREQTHATEVAPELTRGMIVCHYGDQCRVKHGNEEWCDSQTAEDCSIPEEPSVEAANRNGAWVESYKIGMDWEPAMSPLDGNRNYHDQQVNKLDVPFEADFLRLYPVTWHGTMSLRWELMGCDCIPVPLIDRHKDVECRTCSSINPVRPLIGSKDDKVLADSQITASSYLLGYPSNGYGEMFRARIDWHGRTWSSDRNVQGEHIKVAFPEKTRITHIATAGNVEAKSYVTEYQLGNNFPSTGPVFDGNFDAVTTVQHSLYEPIETTELKIYPLDWKKHMSMRVEMMGCTCIEAAGTKKTDLRGVPEEGMGNTACGRQLIGKGLTQRLIPDDAISVSKMKNGYGCHKSGRLYSAGAICFDPPERGQTLWVTWDLGSIRKVEGILTQGHPVVTGWITAFALQGSTDGFWHKTQAVDMQGNIDQNTVKINKLDAPMRARYVRLIVKTSSGSDTSHAGEAGLRAELIGCADSWNLPEEIRVGQLDGIYFNLIYPRFYDGRVFYYLDSDGDGEWKSTIPKGDAVSVEQLQRFLSQGPYSQLSETTNDLLVVSGYRLRMPGVEMLKKVLLGIPSAAGTEWPARTFVTSTTAVGATGAAHQHLVAQATMIESDTVKNLVGFELVMMPDQIEYLEYAGKCDLSYANPSPATWMDGSALFKKKGYLGSTLMCQEFCSRRAPECSGFIYDRRNHDCAWLQGPIVADSSGSPETDFTCFASRQFQCAYSFPTCPRGYNAKTGDIWCEDAICSRDDCCDPIGKCTIEVCGKAHVVKENAPSSCAEHLCTLDECCVPRATCSPLDCPSPAFTLRNGSLPPYCHGEACTSEECCYGMSVCRHSDCPAPFMLRSEEPIYCKEQQACTMLECCQEVGTCESYTCPKGSRDKAKETLCSTARCADKECCEMLGTCATDFESCPTGFIMNSEKYVPGQICENDVCHYTECCTNAPECSAQDCPDGFTLKDPEHLTYCTGEACTANECCKHLGQCTQIHCPMGNRKRRNGEHEPDFCRGEYCTVDECCLEQGRCLGNICVNTEGYTWKAVANMPEFCDGPTCTLLECCEKLGVCSPDVCSEGWRVKPRGAPNFCSGPACTEQECCSHLAVCKKADCSHAQGFLLKEEPPVTCIDSYCTRDECCDVARSCSEPGDGFQCPKGMALTYDVYCQSATSCTADECCAPGEAEEHDVHGKQSLIEQQGARLIRREHPDLETDGFAVAGHVLLESQDVTDAAIVGTRDAKSMLAAPPLDVQYGTARRGSMFLLVSLVMLGCFGAWLVIYKTRRRKEHSPKPEEDFTHTSSDNADREIDIQAHVETRPDNIDMYEHERSENANVFEHGHAAEHGSQEN